VVPLLDRFRALPSFAAGRRIAGNYFGFCRIGMSRQLWLAFLLCLVFVYLIGASLYMGRDFRVNYEYLFGPVVATACGHGYKEIIFDPAVASATAAQTTLQNFLSYKSNTFSCAALDVAGVSYKSDLWDRPYQIYTNRLFQLIGLVWSLTEPSWNAVNLVFGLAIASVFVSVFSVAYLLIGNAWAFLPALAMSFSPNTALYMPSLRDFSKLPFMFGMLALCLWLLRIRDNPKQSIVFCLLAGLFAGYGLGFRTDIVLMFIPFMLVLFCDPAIKRLRAFLIRIGCALVFLGATFGSNPQATQYYFSGKTISAHVIALGFGTSFEKELGLAPATYDFGTPYSDEYQIQLTNFTAYTHGLPEQTYLSKEYNATLSKYFRELILTFPGDFLTRCVQSLTQSFRWPQTLHGSVFAPMAGNVLPLIIVTRVGETLSTLWLWPLLLTAVWIIAFIRRDYRIGLFYATFLFLIASVTLQYAVRHYHYLEGFYWIMLAIVLGYTWRLASSLSLDMARQAAIGAAAGLALVIFCGACLWLARTIQEPQVQQLAQRYMALPGKPYSYSVVDEADGMALLAPNGPLHDIAGQPATLPSKPIRSFYFRLRLNAALCPDRVVDVILPVSRHRSEKHLARTFSTFLPAQEMDSVIMAPAFDSAFMGFIGFRIAQQHLPCLKSIETVSTTAETDMPLAWQFWAKGERPDIPANAAMKRGLWEHRQFGLSLFGRPQNLVPWYQVEEVLRRSTCDVAWGWNADTIAKSGDTYVSEVASRFGYLLMTPEIPFRKGQILATYVNVSRGGLQTGLLENNHWVALEVNGISERGWQYITAPKDFTGRFVIADYQTDLQPGETRRRKFVVEKTCSL
jgi:hypothetical protein